MDGTILDTVPGLKEALTYAMDCRGHRTGFTDDEVKLFFGSGVTEAIRRALRRNGEVLDGSGAVDEAEVRAIQEVYMPYYEQCCGEGTRPYTGVPELLAALKSEGYKLAVVSNKPDPAVQSLAEQYFPGIFDYSVGERPGVKRKPAGDMTRAALTALGATEATAVYVGDSEVDLETARNGGLPCIAVSWGFRPRAYLVELGASPLADRPEDVLQALREMNAC